MKKEKGATYGSLFFFPLSSLRKMKLTKKELKLAQEIDELINKPQLSIDEVERIYTDFHPGYYGDIAGGSAFFTPLDLAMDTALMGASRQRRWSACIRHLLRIHRSGYIKKPPVLTVRCIAPCGAVHRSRSKLLN